MSFKRNDYRQFTLDDSFLNLSPRVKRIVENSWCRDFADIVFPAIDEERFCDTICYCKGEEADSRLKKALKEAGAVPGLMAEDPWHGTQEYQLLLRVILEQTEQDGNGNRIPRDKKNITADSLQNPSDPDAAFRLKAGKGHKGYVANVIGTVGEEGSLITDLQYEKNTCSDSQFCKDYISKKEGAAAETLIADGTYGGTGNQKLAPARNINLVAACLTGKDPDKLFAKFELNESGDQVLRCPEGHTPFKTTCYPKTGMCRALFPANCCEQCPNREICKAKAQRKSFAVHVSGKMVQRARYLGKLSAEEYRNLTRQRNAIEGIPPVLRRKYRVDDIPVFGLLRSGTFMIFKAMAYNFAKVRHDRQRQRDICALQLAIS